MADFDPNELDTSDIPAVVAENEQALLDAGQALPPHAADLQLDPANLLTDAELQDAGLEMEKQAAYGDSPLTTFGLAAADTAGFSIPGRVLDKTGILSAQEQKEMRDRNPVSDTLGTATGIVAPLLVGNPSGFSGALLKGATVSTRAGTAAERVAASILKKGLGDAGSSTLAKNIVRKSIEKTAQGAAEGGIQGFNQLLREDALGDADFNAESLLTHVGTGALYGGIANAGLSLSGQAIKGAARAVAGPSKSIFDKAFKKFFDPSKAAEELTGLPTTKVAKMQSQVGGKELLEDLPRWYTEDVGLSAFGDDAEKVVEKVGALERSAGKEIEATLKAIDDKAATSMPTVQLNKATEFGSIADELQAKYVAPNTVLDEVTGRVKHLKTFAAQNMKIMGIVDDLRTMGRQSGPVTGAELVKIKRQLDALAKGFYERGIGAAPSAYEKAAFKARDMVNNLGKKYAASIDTELAAQLAKANQNVYYAKTVLPSLQKKAAKSGGLLGFKDTLIGAAGIFTGHGAIGGAVLGAKKVLESDFRRRLVILSGIERANLAVNKRLKDAASTFVKGSARVGRPASVNALIGSALAQKRADGKAPEQPKNKIEAYNNTRENLSNLMVKSDELLDKSVKASAAISYGAPQTASLMGQRMVKGLQFLHSKVPKRPYEATFPSGKQKPYTPSAQEIAKFERYLQVVDSPLSVMDDLESGALTREHVEALRVVYPRLFSELQQSVLEQLRDADESKLSYNKRVQISMLLEIPGDASLIGHNIAALQSTFQPPEMGDAAGGPVQGGGGPQPGSGRPPAGQGAALTGSQRTASDTQGFAARRAKA